MNIKVDFFGGGGWVGKEDMGMNIKVGLADNTLVTRT